MLKQKALRKILVTTFAVFILFVLYLIPDIQPTNRLNPVTEVEYVDELNTDVVYLLSNDRYLVKAHLLLEGNDTLSKAKSIVKTLTINQNKNLPSGFTGIIPEKTILEEVTFDKGILTLNFNKELLSIDADLEERMVEALVYSLTSLDGVEGITIRVENEVLEALPHRKKPLPSILTTDFGINKVYEFSQKDDIHKVVVYYLLENDDTYYVPVTKYVNDSRDKIEIIIDNLSSSYIYQPNLTSFLDREASLLNYEISDGLMILEFNDHLFDGNQKVLEEVLYTISYSVFDNYDVNEVLFQVGEESVFKQLRTELP